MQAGSLCRFRLAAIVAALGGCGGEVDARQSVVRLVDEDAPVEVMQTPAGADRGGADLLEWAEATHVNISTIAAERWGVARFESRRDRPGRR